MISFKIDTNGTLYFTVKSTAGGKEEIIIRIIDIETGEILANIINIEDKILLGEMMYGSGALNDNSYYF